MTTRDDVVVDFNESPRIAEVAAPSTFINQQDLVDTLRKIEDQFALGMSHPKLIDASGKEPLGGAIQVGITTALQNTKIGFEARRTPVETGTVTTGSGVAIKGKYSFVDSAADFSSVESGALVINFSDRSIADVVRVDNNQQLTTKVLVNGTTNTFQVGDVYHVFNIVQVEVGGGNTTAVDDVGTELNPIQPSAFTQVVRSASSSATIVQTGSGVTEQDKLDIADEVWERTAEGSMSYEQGFRLLCSVIFNNADGLETGVPRFMSLDGAKSRVEATYSEGTRTVSKRDGT